MTGNSSLFSTFQSQSSPSTITLANGSQSYVLGLGTVFPTSFIPLSSILTNFSYNFVSVNKLTRALQCCVSFFPNYYLFQDLMTKQIIGRGYESRGLYILDTAVPRPIVCSNVTHFILSHPSLPLLNKLHP